MPCVLRHCFRHRESDYSRNVARCGPVIFASSRRRVDRCDNIVRVMSKRDWRLICGKGRLLAQPPSISAAAIHYFNPSTSTGWIEGGEENNSGAFAISA